MKQIYIGGQTVSTGTYINLGNARPISVTSRATLPGSIDRKYLKIPEILSLILAPLIGLFYIVVMPFVGIVVIIYFLCLKTVLSIRGYVGHLRGE